MSLGAKRLAPGIASGRQSWPGAYRWRPCEEPCILDHHTLSSSAKVSGSQANGEMDRVSGLNRPP